jgi:hypothetical protein
MARMHGHCMRLPSRPAHLLTCAWPLLLAALKAKLASKGKPGGAKKKPMSAAAIAAAEAKARAKKSNKGKDTSHYNQAPQRSALLCRDHVP